MWVVEWFHRQLQFLIEKRGEFANEPLIPPALVNGKDLITMGMTPGPRFKNLLEAIQTEQLEGRLHDRETALDLLRTLVSSPDATESA